MKVPETEFNDHQIDLNFTADNSSGSQSIQLQMETSTCSILRDPLTICVGRYLSFEIWLLVSKRFSLSSTISTWTNDLDLPRNFLVDGMLCKPCHELFTKEEFVYEQQYLTPPSDPEIVLEYRPLEPRNQPYELGVFGEQFEFSFRSAKD